MYLLQQKDPSESSKSFFWCMASVYVYWLFLNKWSQIQVQYNSLYVYIHICNPSFHLKLGVDALPLC